MNQIERINSFPEALQMAFDGHQAQTWTTLPGIIQSFDPDAITAVVQPAIKAQVRSPDGSTQWVALPLLLDCPVVFPRGGGCTLTFPLGSDEGSEDECLVSFSSRCIDAWWSSGGIQVQSELRMHDLSDGFAIPGPFSQATKISGISMTSAQLRSNDGQAFVGLNPTSHEIDITTSGNWNSTIGGAANITVTGDANISAENVAVVATGAASVTAPSITLGASAQSLLSFVTSAFMSLFNGHTHPDPQGGNSSAPTQQMTAAHLTTTVKGG